MELFRLIPLGVMTLAGVVAIAKQVGRFYMDGKARGISEFKQGCAADGLTDGVGFCYAVQSNSRTGAVMDVVAGVDLGGTAVNYTLIDQNEKFLIDGLCEHPALSRQGPDVCLQQIADGLAIAAGRAGVSLSSIVAIGLDTPGPASAAGELSARGSTNFVHPKWAGFDIREGLARKLGKPVSYLNDANAAALWGHYAIFGANSKETSISDVVGTGNGGGIILDGIVVKGKN